MRNGSQFKAALAAWADKVGEQADGLARAVCQETGFRVVKNTPIDTGYLRGSWQPSIGAIQTSAKAQVGDSMADVALICTGIKAGDVFYMTNNAAYARRIEYGFVGQDSLGRYYNQPPRYFVRDTVAKYDEIVTMSAQDLGMMK